MCLDTITKRYKRPSAKVVKAWKVFDVLESGTRYEFPYEPMGRSFHVPFKTWLTAKECTVKITDEIDGERIGYTSGFHAYTEPRDIPTAFSQRRVVAVRLRGIHTIGTQSGYTVLVAREMYVPKPRTKKVSQ